jgi:hypothetical protein
MTDGIELKTLVGLHRLSGVDRDRQAIKSEWGDYDEDCDVISFVLDGKTYTATEDPSDGYRSCMKNILMSRIKVKNRFKPCKVMCQMRGDSEYGESNDILDMTDVKTGKVVLSVGTCNYDDYYPYFVSEFNPENMAMNFGVTHG